MSRRTNVTSIGPDEDSRDVEVMIYNRRSVYIQSYYTGVTLTPDQALKLLAWLTQQQATLEQIKVEIQRDDEQNYDAGYEVQS